MENLWPENIGKIKPSLTPKNILEKQGEYLENATNGYIYGRVKQQVLPFEPNKFEFKFELVGKLLNNYTFSLLTIRHSVDIYPMTVEINSEIAKELKIEKYYTYKVNSEKEFEELLVSIFKTDKLSNLIKSILSLSQ